jgi:hypothetical protein
MQSGLNGGLPELGFPPIVLEFREASVSIEIPF